MARYENGSPEQTISRGLLGVGAALIAAGGLIALAGTAVSATAVATALRRQVKASGMPPSELAMHHWRRAKSAAQAGSNAWRMQVPAQMTHPPTARSSVG